ncbi:MAG: phosphoribosyltransferase [Haloquadratum sp.]
MSSPPTFADRDAAGEQLADAMQDRGIDPDIVLAIPRGGLPLGRAVADAFGVPLDIVVAKKIGAPNNPEYAIGAVATDGSVWRNEEAIRRTRAGEDYLEEERAKMEEKARAKAERYRGDREEPDLRGKSVAIVDDGVATGSTARACLEMLANAEAERIVLAVPVGPPDSIHDLEEMADEVVCLATPRNFGGVGQFYERFGQVTDEEAMEYLDA